MSVYDEMYDCIETARSTDACEYSVYSEMFDLIAEAETENAKLCELVTAQKLLVDAVHTYWADGMNQEQFNMLMRLTARVDRLCDEIGIGVDT